MLLISKHATSKQERARTHVNLHFVISAIVHDQTMCQSNSVRFHRMTCNICVIPDIRIVEVCDSFLRTGTISSWRVERGEGSAHLELVVNSRNEFRAFVSSQETYIGSRPKIRLCGSIRRLLVKGCRNIPKGRKGRGCEGEYSLLLEGIHWNGTCRGLFEAENQELSSTTAMKNGKKRNKARLQSL